MKMRFPLLSLCAALSASVACTTSTTAGEDPLTASGTGTSSASTEDDGGSEGASETETDGGDGDSTTGGDGDSTTGGDGDSTSGGDGDSTSGGDGDSTSGGDGDSTSGGDGDSTSGGDGDSTSGGDGDSTSGGDGDSTSGGDGDSTSGGDGDSTSGGDGDGDGDGETEVSWLLNSEGGKLYKIDRYTAATTELCDLIDPDDQGSIEFSSMTFSRDDHLYGSHSGSLYEVTLPGCEVTKIGPFGGAITSVNGISPDEAYGLFAIDTSTDSVYRVDPATAIATLVGPAGYNIGFGGATWVEAEQKLMAVDAGNQTLNEVNTTTGTYTSLGNLSTSLNLVGFEHHPHGGNLYICSSGSAEGLWEVDLTGQMTYIGSIGFACNDLAAPWQFPPLPE